MSPRFGLLFQYAKRVPRTREWVMMVFSIEPLGTVALIMMTLSMKKARATAMTITSTQLRTSFSIDCSPFPPEAPPADCWLLSVLFGMWKPLLFMKMILPS